MKKQFWCNFLMLSTLLGISGIRHFLTLVIARRIIGPHHLKQLRDRDEIYIRQLKEQCKTPHSLRSTRTNMAEIEKQRQIRAVFNRGNEIIQQNKPKNVQYIQVQPDASLKREDRTLVSMLGAVLGFMVCCTVGLVGRHHGDSISKTYKKTNMGSISKLGIISIT